MMRESDFLNQAIAHSEKKTSKAKLNFSFVNADIQMSHPHPSIISMKLRCAAEQGTEIYNVL